MRRGLVGSLRALTLLRICHASSLSSVSSSECISVFYSDGYCDDINNIAECGFDGGDCCKCTCVDGENYACGSNGFTCEDPDGIIGELYECQPSPPAARSCPTDDQVEWFVRNTTEAQALADASNCSGGTFDVKWDGIVVVDSPIYVIDGTMMNVTGVASNSSIDGQGKSRLFTVVNASLSLEGLTLRNGSAVSGGAIAVSYSKLVLTNTVFENHVAPSSGGAIFCIHESKVLFKGQSTFRYGKAQASGGSIFLSGSSATWVGAMRISGSSAEKGGAMYMTNRSKASWSSEASFVRNSADGDGGAIYLTNGSSGAWAGVTTFSDNIATYDGGALFVSYSSGASWTGSATFAGNAAVGPADVYAADGGALCILHDSYANWTAETTFSGNMANAWGGALYVWSGSSVSWEAPASFVGNTAGIDGGALYLLNSTAAWSTNCSWFNNTALNGAGGAVLVTDGSTLVWNGRVTFLANEAGADGGAIGSKAYEASPSSSTESFLVDTMNDDESSIVFKGVTIFANNTSGGNGGGIAMSGMLSASFATTPGTIFETNRAAVSGGAVSIYATGTGPSITNVSFVANTAPLGGAVYASASGTTIRADARVGTSTSPTTFDGCSFRDNVAGVAGGAVDSVLGRDAFVRSSFVANSAGTGGALRLAGTSSLENCSFEGNHASADGGPAVNNMGVITDVKYITFQENFFSCEAGSYLTFNTSGDEYGAVCSGCPLPCDDCIFNEPSFAPRCMSLVEAGVEHATSPGGTVTVEELSIERGYWRSTPTSTLVLECYNKNACPGGPTSGICAVGYEGAYCSVCSEDYTVGLGSTCTACSGSTWSFVLAVILGVVGALVALGLVHYLVSGTVDRPWLDIVDRIARRIPLHSIKIIIVAWQILTQFASVANVTYPDVYRRFLDGLDVFNFDLSWLMSAGCIIDVNFYDKLLISTLGPICAIAVLGLTYGVARMMVHAHDVAALRVIRRKHVSMVLLVTFLVYSNSSSVLFRMFACDDLDDGKSYLRADYRLHCDSTKHRWLQVYAAFMILVFPLGIPALYAWLLLRNRRILQDRVIRQDAPRVQATSDLWKPYRPSRFYYEVVECLRRILLTCVVLLIDNDTAAQVAVTLMIALFFVFVSEGLAPYESRLDSWVSRTGHAVVFTSMFFALLLKVDVSKERHASQRAFEITLIAAHGCMVLAVVLEATAMVCTLRRGKQTEDPLPRLSRTTRHNWGRETSLVFDGDPRSDQPPRAA